MGGVEVRRSHGCVARFGNTLYLEDEGLHKLALYKADDKEFILSWNP